jgi:hypothetical protein
MRFTSPGRHNPSIASGNARIAAAAVKMFGKAGQNKTGQRH